MGMRLIDADALADALFGTRKNYPQWVADTIGNMPEAVVRCKDCKHVCICDAKEMFPDMPVYAKCTLTDETHEPDWFCADGERKNG